MHETETNRIAEICGIGVDAATLMMKIHLELQHRVGTSASEIVTKDAERSWKGRNQS
jgi:hypothetical protein